ncbi:MAG: PEP-CTERM sorting domain-containing protein, partial [Planctomycetota bacterium]
ETLTLTLLGEVLAAGFIDGDYNGDGTVGQADLDLVLQNWGSSELPAEWLAVDQFQTALISGAELDGVLLNWGDTASSNVAIPEPTSAAGLVALGGLLGRRRCGRDARAV